LISLVLFAYRDAVQESTGFSPFELTSTHDVRGAMDVLKESWTPIAQEPNDIAEYVSKIQMKMRDVNETVQENLRKAQNKQKCWYDKRARMRELSAGEQVLLLLPDSTSMFRRQWRGPYKVVRRIGKVSYEVEMSKHECTKIFHINLLRKWNEREENCYANMVEDNCEMEEYRWIQEAPQFGDQLDSIQKRDIEECLNKYPDVIANRPGQAKNVAHKIHKGPSRHKTKAIPHTACKERSSNGGATATDQRWVD
jgi:hypothetical protein